MMFSNATPRSTVLCLSLSITTLFLLSLLSIPILLKAGQLSFLVSAGAHLQSKVCGPHRPYDRTWPKYYRYMPELQPSEFTLESMKEMTWDERLTTPNGGFLRVQKEDGSIMGYGISMMHHIHCLIMVRDMLTGREMNQEFEVGGELHWAHCLDYMANAIMCHADDTLEPPGQATHFEKIEAGGLDGQPHLHQCRNATKIFERMLEAEKNPIHERDLGPGTLFR